jgi:hypothetical protein
MQFLENFSGNVTAWMLRGRWLRWAISHPEQAQGAPCQPQPAGGLLPRKGRDGEEEGHRTE